MKIACFTVAALDYFSQRKEYYAGGNALNQAVRFSQMGEDCSFIGGIGTDEAGDRILSLLDSHPIDLSHLYRLEGITACNEMINDENGERFGVDGAWKNGAYGDFRMSENDWAFLLTHDVWATHGNHPDYLETLSRKTGKQFMAVDFLHLLDAELLEKSLKTIDIAYFGGTEDMAEELAEIAARTGKVIVLTLGGKGSMAFKGGQIYRQDVLPLDKVVDTTGCGDAFQAGFTRQYILSGDPEAALAAGAEWGRVAAGHLGGVRWP